MASNLVVARGGVEFVPPISLAFWRWTLVFLILLPFTYITLKKNFKIINKKRLRNKAFDRYRYKCREPFITGVSCELQPMKKEIILCII